MNYPTYPTSLPGMDRRYSETIEFIAMNDEPTVNEIDYMVDLLSVITASVAFDWPADLIVEDIMDVRVRERLIDREDIC